MHLKPYFKSTRLGFVLLIILLQRQTSTANSGFGSGLKESLKLVENCPDSEEKLREAVEKKKCASFAFNLSKPDEFMYHCVINSYLNQTVEICADKKIIFGVIVQSIVPAPTEFKRASTQSVLIFLNHVQIYIIQHNHTSTKDAIICRKRIKLKQLEKIRVETWSQFLVL